MARRAVGTCLRVLIANVQGFEVTWCHFAMRRERQCLQVAPRGQERKNDCLPWSLEFVRNVAMVLDNFHRKNHTWCLKNLPEVDPQSDNNERLAVGKNTVACEQLTSWIALRTRTNVDLPPGRFLIYWWTLLASHNDWIEKKAASMRRRCARGGLRHDPDKPKVKTKAS